MGIAYGELLSDDVHTYDVLKTITAVDSLVMISPVLI